VSLVSAPTHLVAIMLLFKPACWPCAATTKGTGTALTSAELVVKCLESMYSSRLWQPQLVDLTPDIWCSVATAPAALQQYLDDPHLANRLGADFVRRIKAWFRCDTLLASITCDNPCKHMFHNLLPASCICKASSYAFFSALLCKQCHRVIHLCGHQRPFGLAECMHCIHTVHHLQKASLSAEVAAG